MEHLLLSLLLWWLFVVVSLWIFYFVTVVQGKKWVIKIKVRICITYIHKFIYIGTYVHIYCICVNLKNYFILFIFSNEDKNYRIVHISAILLGILTCGTSVLLWWLYKSITKCLGKEKYDVEGTYTITCIFTYICMLMIRIENVQTFVSLCILPLTFTFW